MPGKIPTERPDKNLRKEQTKTLTNTKDKPNTLKHLPVTWTGKIWLSCESTNLSNSKSGSLRPKISNFRLNWTKWITKKHTSKNSSSKNLPLRKNPCYSSRSKKITKSNCCRSRTKRIWPRSEGTTTTNSINCKNNSKPPSILIVKKYKKSTTWKSGPHNWKSSSKT